MGDRIKGDNIPARSTSSLNNPYSCTVSAKDDGLHCINPAPDTLGLKGLFGGGSCKSLLGFASVARIAFLSVRSTSLLDSSST